jgi:hypothetical protein
MYILQYVKSQMIKHKLGLSCAKLRLKLVCLLGSTKEDISLLPIILG